LLAFGSRVLVHDPVVPAKTILDVGAVPADLNSLLVSSDAVTLHCPSNAQTRRLMNRETIGRMRRGAILLNLSRGDVVESAALVEALQKGHLSAAGLDVFDPEPIPRDSPLLQMGNVVLSAHVASASARAARRLRETVAGTVARAIRGEPLTNVVNGVQGRRSGDGERTV
jgi:D-3-phosphoglycerate dehydrogenase